MTLNELCKCSKGVSFKEQSNLISQFYHELKSKEDELSAIKDFNSNLCCELDIYTTCYIISIYEYLCIKHNISYIRNTLYCSKEQNSVYLLLESGVGTDIATELYNDMLSKSIEPFKSHGIITTEFNFAV